MPWRGRRSQFETPAPVPGPSIPTFSRATYTLAGKTAMSSAMIPQAASTRTRGSSTKTPSTISARPARTFSRSGSGRSGGMMAR